MATTRAHVRITGRSKDASEVTFQAYDELASRLVDDFAAKATAPPSGVVDRRRFSLSLLGTEVVTVINGALGPDAANLRISVQETDGWPFRASGSHRRLMSGAEAVRMVIRTERYQIEVTSWNDTDPDPGPDPDPPADG